MATCHSNHSSESERPFLEEEEEADEQEDEDEEQLQHDLTRLNLGISITTVCIASPMFDIRLRL